LLGARPDGEVVAIIDRTFETVWQERPALHIPQPELKCRPWSVAEDRLVGTSPDAEAAVRVARTAGGVRSHRAILDRERAVQPGPVQLSRPKLCPPVMEDPFVAHARTGLKRCWGFSNGLLRPCSTSVCRVFCFEGFRSIGFGDFGLFSGLVPRVLPVKLYPGNAGRERLRGRYG